MKEKNEFHIGYKALIGAMIGAGCGLSSISFYTHSVFANAISSDTGWSRGDVQLGVSIMILMAIITAPLVGSLIDRFGARIIGLISVPLYSLSMSLFFFVDDNLASYYLAWAFMSILAAGTLPITWTKIVNAWFNRKRGLALGLTLAGTGIAATFGPAYVSLLISEFGWRLSYLILSLTIIIIAFPAVFFLFKDPGSGELALFSDKNNNINVNVSAAEALLGYKFWVMGIALIFAAAGISGLITSSVPILVDKGLKLSEAAQYAGLIGLSVILGRLLVGVLLDYFWAPLVAAVFLAAPIFTSLIFSSHLESGLAISLSMIILGLAAGAELDLLAFLVSRYFGLLDYGKLYGGQYIFFSIGAGLAPAAFGKAFDIFGNYDLALNLVAITSIASGLLILTLGRYPEVREPY